MGIRRTQQGLLLERLMGTIQSPAGGGLRYLFCYNGEEPEESYDCGCCMSWTPFPECNCICRERFERMANTCDLPLLFKALQLVNEFPALPSSIDELEKLKDKAKQ